MLKSDYSALSRFFTSQAETDRSLAELGDLYPAYRAVMVSDGTLTQMLSALHLEEISTHTVENVEGIPDAEQRGWLETDVDETCVRRRVTLNGAVTGRTYVRALSYLYPPRLPASFLMEMNRPGSSLGSQLLASRIHHRRELLWVRTGPDHVFSRLYRILLRDRPAILIQEEFLDGDVPPWELTGHPGTSRR
ncbi:chorismate lyase [Streptomyces zhaozhouensis]|uniref:Chorismate lyase n=1 Tax=Streptomyces zhaozhouensis TaxID=1300267 RepID=A0A286E040_9ACTN|nr:chorismate pyruvate-lyase family protein [Streptomyces zhaozhouensis]SOD64267.1 chorismate lyase [Streptomyces zhaozhouensis]